MDTDKPQKPRQQSLNTCRCWILYFRRAVLQHVLLIEALSVFRGNMVCVNAATPQESMEPPHFSYCK